jgi:16S rRNA (cytosine967-C5)-methyltransferase
LWLVEKWLKEWGPDVTRTILSHNNSRTTLVIRANRIKTTPEELLSLLHSSGIDARPTIPEPDALLVSARRPVHQIPGFQEGLFAVQDSASQMVAPLLSIQPRERILDACAAPGGKTAHLAALAGNEAEITAMDSDASRLDEARQNMARLGCKGITVLHGDARSSEFLMNLGTFDRILLDPPCSNLGVLRHNPEIKYRIEPEDLRQFSDAHLKMLCSVAEILRTGGSLVFSVCTVTAEETVDVAQKFLDLYPQFSVAPILPSEVPSSRFTNPRGDLSTFPPTGPESVDGFFAVRLIKS